jgi:hypothetical protein
VKTKFKAELTVPTQNNTGVVLIGVLCLTVIAAVLVVGLMSESSSHLKLAQRNVYLEQAFYVAEGGVERAAAYIRNGGTVPTNLTGTIGNGRYSTYILSTPDTTGSGNTHTVSGQININPNNSPKHEFLLMTTDGQAFDREALQNSSLPDYSGNAYLIHVKPKGNSDQTITVDGSLYTLDKNMAYTFTGPSIPVVLYNDNRDTNGLAMGQWWININGSGISFGDDAEPDSSSLLYYSVYSMGMVEKAQRTILIDGLHQQSWAKYALWYNSGPGQIWIKSGEVFNGPVHANTYIYLQGDPVFNALISSTMSSWGSGSDTSSVSFNQGYLFNAPSQSMASVNFNDLLGKSDLVVSGQTFITLSGSNILLSNSRQGWTNNPQSVISNHVLYVRNAASGSSTQGTINVGGVLDGRLTLVADYDIQVTNHITYTVHPTNSSDDALGLIARRDLIIMTNAPSDLSLFAHIMAVGSATPTVNNDGSFRVANYDTRAVSGFLNVYGGIVQFYRGAVGTFDPWSGQMVSGFAKNYTFDTRFENNPPPQYPTLTNEYIWTGWRDK